MSTITLTILNRTISLNCQDGDETKITAVADRLNTRMQHLKQQLQASDMETLLIGSVILLDELESATAKHDSLKAHIADTDVSPHTTTHLENAVTSLENLIADM